MEIEWPDKKIKEFDTYNEQYPHYNTSNTYIDPCKNCPCNKNGNICHCTLPYRNTIT